MSAVGPDAPDRRVPAGPAGPADPAEPQISPAEITRLLRTHAPGPSVVSVYLTVPLDPAERRGIPARLDDLMRAAGHGPAAGEALARARRSQLPVIKNAVSARAGDWLGHSVAIFA